MLESSNFPSLANEPRALASKAGVTEMIGTALGIVRRQKWIVGGFAAVGLLLAGAFLYATPRVYQASAEIFFDRGNRPVVTQTPVLTDAPFDSSFFESQGQIIKSDKIALSVVKKLGLANDPEFTSGDLLAVLLNFLRRGEPATEAEREELAASHLVQKLDAKRVGLTYFVDITFQSTRASTAESVVKAVVDAYIADQRDTRFESARVANEWLQQRLEELRRKATLDEQAVNAYKAKNKIVSASGGLIGDQSMSALNTELAAARAKASDALARMERMQAILQSDDAHLAVEASVSEALVSPIITQLRQDYLALNSKADEYALRYGKGHRAVTNLQEKVRELELAIRAELRRLVETSKSEYLIAARRQENIEKDLALAVSQSQATSRAQVALRDLESAAQSSRSLYNLFQGRFLEAAQQQSMSMSDVRLNGPIVVNNQKRAPKILGLGLVAGLALGVGISALRELMNRSFLTSRQVSTALKIPCVSLVPSLPALEARPWAREQDAGGRIISSSRPPLSTIQSERFSPFTEAIRSIKIAADLTLKYSAAPASKGTVIGFSSSGPGEGKSTTAVAFAQLAASVGRRSIIVDCDLRNPSISRSFAPNAVEGVAEVLSGTAMLENVIWREPLSGLTLLPAVRPLPTDDPYEILAAASLKRLLEALRDRYDYVVLDLSPMGPVAEVQATVELVDFYFFVIEWGRTKIETVERVLSEASDVYERIAGIVLTKVNMDEIRRYDLYDYKRYNERHATGGGRQ